MGNRFVSFSLGDGRYCVPVGQVVQILRLEGLMEIPKPPPFVEGVISLRGDIIPVVNLKARLGVPPATRAGEDNRKRRVIIAHLEGRYYGLDVDEVRDIVDINPAGIAQDATTLFGARAEFIAGLAHADAGPTRADAGPTHADAGLWVILDLVHVLGIRREIPGGLPGSAAGPSEAPTPTAETPTPFAGRPPEES